MKLPQNCRSIEEVRKEIDEIDHTIISLIGKRFSFIKEIIKYKNSTDDVFAEKRYQEVITERRKFASVHHVNPDLIEGVYRLMMDFSIKEQLRLLKNKQKNLNNVQKGN